MRILLIISLMFLSTSVWAQFGEVEISSGLLSEQEGIGVEVTNLEAEDLFCSKIDVKANYYPLGGNILFLSKQRSFLNLLVEGDSSLKFYYLPGNPGPNAEGRQSFLASKELLVHNSCWEKATREQYCRYAEFSSHERQKSLVYVVKKYTKGTCEAFARTRITKVKLAHTKISDLKVLSYIPELRYLDLSYSKVTDLRYLKGLRDLRKLSLEFTKVSDLEALAGLDNLIDLDIQWLRLENLSVLLSIPKLRFLDIRSADIKDISVLERLPNLCVRFYSDQIEDVSLRRKLRKRNRSRYCR